MDFKRYYIGKYPNPMYGSIPEACLRDKTIYINNMHQLWLTKDRRPEAVDYINNIIPRLGCPFYQKLLSWFWNEMPDNGFLEFDYSTKVLCFCQIQKK